MNDHPLDEDAADRQALLLLELMLGEKMDEACLMFDSLPAEDYSGLASRALRLAAVTLRMAFGDNAEQKVTLIKEALR